jgi:hypothetical protein
MQCSKTGSIKAAHVFFNFQDPPTTHTDLQVHAFFLPNYPNDRVFRSANQQQTPSKSTTNTDSNINATNTSTPAPSSIDRKR